MQKPKLPLKWDEMTIETKEWYLNKACLNTKFAAYKWDDIETWLKALIKDAFKLTPRIILTDEL